MVRRKNKGFMRMHKIIRTMRMMIWSLGKKIIIKAGRNKRDNSKMGKTKEGSKEWRTRMS